MSISETIDSCRICCQGDLQEILDLGNQPPANSLRLRLSENLPSIPLIIVRCSDCGAIQLRDTVDPSFLFEDYVWVTGTSRTADEYSRDFFARAVQRGEEAGFVVEVASNDGTFLRRFQENGFQVLGVDPARNLAEQANQSDVPTLAEFFSLPVAKQILKDRSSAQYVIARNVIPHVKEVRSVIEGMGHLLNPENGVGIIEFHHAKIILDELHYDSIYHEHLLYLTASSMARLLGEFGLEVFDVTESPISGGSLVVYFSKKSRPRSQAWIDALEQEEREGLNSLEKWLEFARNCSEHSQKLLQMVRTHIESDDAPLIGYGASARSSTLLNYCNIGVDELDGVIDKNPLKVGKYTPGSNLPILGFSEGLDVLKKGGRTVLLLAWNFEDEIVADLKELGVKAKVIVPLPNDPREYEI